MPSHTQSPTFGMFGTMQTSRLTFNSSCMYCAAPMLLMRGPPLVGAMLREWKQSRGTPTPAITNTLLVS